ALGLLFAQWGSRLLVGFLSTSTNHLFLDLAVDARVLGFTIAIGIATGLVFGLAPAWRSARMQPHQAMKAEGRGVAEGHSRFNLGKAMVVAQVALSAVLIVGAGLMLGSFRNLATLDPGFQRDHILLMNLDMRNGQYPQERLPVVYNDMLTHLRAIPGVVSASSSMITPVSNKAWDDEIIVEGYTPNSRQDADVFFNRVSDRYFETLGTPMLAGRDFNPQDTAVSTRVAVVNETLAKKFFGTTNPLGRTFRAQAGATPDPPVQIVGVVKDAKYQSLREDAVATAYVPAAQEAKPRAFINFELRSTAPETDLIASAKTAIAEVSHDVTMDFIPLATQ
ncbi:MAG: ABC transporter permease, partial [Blastocatellia bacterium]